MARSKYPKPEADNRTDHELATDMLLDPAITEGVNCYLIERDVDRLHFRIAGMDIEYRRRLEGWLPRLDVSVNGQLYISVVLGEKSSVTLAPERVKKLWGELNDKAYLMEEQARDEKRRKAVADLARWKRNKDSDNPFFDGYPTPTGYLGQPDDE